MKPRVSQLAQSGATAGQILTWSGSTWAPADPPTTGGGGGGATDPRLLFEDNADVSAVPLGASNTGQLTYDATAWRRVLGGTSASEYDLPAETLHGTLLCEIEVTWLANHTAGNAELQVYKSTSLIATIAFQSDGNDVAYTSAHSPPAASGSYTHVTGASVRAALSISEEGRVNATVGPTTGGTGVGFSTTYASGLAGLAAGDTVTFKVTTASTRQIGLSRLRIRHA